MRQAHRYRVLDVDRTVHLIQDAHVIFIVTPSPTSMAPDIVFRTLRYSMWSTYFVNVGRSRISIENWALLFLRFATDYITGFELLLQNPARIIVCLTKIGEGIILDGDTH